MGIKFNDKIGGYVVSYHARHPRTGTPYNLKRTKNEKGQKIATEADAQRIYQSLVAELQKKFHEQVVPRWKTLISLWRDWVLENERQQRSTADNAVLSLNKHTLEIWGNRSVDTIKTIEIQKYIREGLKDKSENTRKNLLKFIRWVFQYGVEMGALSRNPAPQMKFRPGDKIKGLLTQSEMRTLLEKAKETNNEWYPIWATACYTGMRNGEIYALTWDKVNLETRQIKVDTSWNNTDKFKSTKSGDDRIVEIALPLVQVFKELKLENGGSSCFVLPRLDKWDKGEQARELRFFLMGMGLPPVRFHDLRASWATLMISRGTEPAKVMVMGGWKDLKTMMIYMRKAGIPIKGITDGLDLHNPNRDFGRVLSFQQSQLM